MHTKITWANQIKAGIAQPLATNYKFAIQLTAEPTFFITTTPPKQWGKITQQRQFSA